MSEHYGPFDAYKEVMLDDGGIFGLNAGETLDVLEDGGVDIKSEVVEEAESSADPEPSDPEPPAEPEPSLSAEAIALAEAQKNPEE